MKRQLIDEEYLKLEDSTLSELHALSIEICKKIMSVNPNSWKTEVNNSPKYRAIIQLIKEKKK